jgi:hypothetical protein
MMRKLTSIVALLLVTIFTAQAHEGMWLMHMLKKINEAEMQNLGLNLTADDIYNINNASLKDAIVRLNGGMCTAEIISGEGLVLTNHHCGYGAIQSLSTVDNDYLTNGFWAMSKGQELPIDGFEVSFLDRIEDVTARVLEGIDHSTPTADRAAKIGERMEAIQAEIDADGSGLSGEVKSFYYGNEFYLFVYNTYRDVRLVGNPPEAIGKYGGDTDNWMWPRHTGDFSLMRIYADKDNKPADYSADNIPLTPKHHLPVSLNGVKDGDFSMIMGYPGSTDRFLSSYGVKQAIDLHNPSVVEVRDMKLKTMKKHMDADPAVRLKYAAKHAQTANYWKYYIGQTKGLKRLDVYNQKKDLEDKFASWVEQDPKRKSVYGDALSMIETFYKSTDATEKGNVYALEAGLIGADITLFAFRFSRTFGGAMKQEGAEAQAGVLGGFSERADGFFKDYDMATDRDILTQLLTMYKKNIPADQLPDIFALIDSKYKGSIERFVDKMYATSFMVDRTKLDSFIAKPSQKVYDKDLAIKLASSIYDAYAASFSNPEQEKFDIGYRLFVDGLRKMQPKKAFYPDANSTMRLTYGQVGDYYPADGVHYDFVTTANGIIEKKDNSNPEFVVDDKLDRMIRAKKFGQYADENGELIVCFISNNDITGGNSGSPVINGDGHLIGLAFDGNWEAMSGDIAFEQELQRTISVDIRYVMWVIGEYAGAKNLIDEIDFVKTKPVRATDIPVDAKAQATDVKK